MNQVDFESVCVVRREGVIRQASAGGQSLDDYPKCHQASKHRKTHVISFLRPLMVSLLVINHDGSSAGSVTTGDYYYSYYYAKVIYLPVRHLTWMSTPTTMPFI